MANNVQTYKITMTGKERILATLHGQPVDRLCWSPLVDRYFIRSLPLLGFPALNVPDTCRLIKADVMERHCPVVDLKDDSSIKRHSRSTALGRVDIIETPVGTLTTEIIDHKATGRDHIHKFPVETLDDIKTFTYINEHSFFERNYQAYDEWSQRIGNDGIATAEGSATPLQVFLMDVCGLQKTIYLLMDYEKEMKECFQAIHNQSVQGFKLMAEGPADVIISYENTSSTVISPEYYQKYCAEFLDEYADICHSGDKIYLTHMCGKLSVFTQQLRNGRQDGIDSVCPPTTGDIWADEARLGWGNDKIIVGGIEPPKLAQMSVAETEKYVTNILDRMLIFKKFILSTGDATAFGTPIENLLTVAKVVKNYPWK